jgi:hypothetical protein
MTAKEPTGVVWSVEFVNVLESYQQNLWKTLCKLMLSRLESLSTLAVIADCTRNDHSTNCSRYFAYSKFCDFSLGAELSWRNGLSSGSFPQLDVSTPRPSRLSEGVLGKIPTDKETQQDHTLKR